MTKQEETSCCFVSLSLLKYLLGFHCHITSYHTFWGLKTTPISLCSIAQLGSLLRVFKAATQAQVCWVLHWSLCGRICFQICQVVGRIQLLDVVKQRLLFPVTWHSPSLSQHMCLFRCLESPSLLFLLPVQENTWLFKGVA